MTKSPLQSMKEQFGEKAKLIEALKQLTGEDLWVGRTSEAKGLERISNSKLLRLHRVFTAVKSEFGTRQKLIDAIIDQEKRGKDQGFKDRLSAYPVPRLYDMWKSGKKRAAAAKKAAAGGAKSASPG